MKICFIGAGNLATQLGIALKENGHSIIQVYSRTLQNATTLARKLNSTPTNSITEIDNNADLYIIAISDQAINELLKSRSWNNHLVVHTAGSIPMDILSPYCMNHGVFYPFQTFSIDKKVNFESVPICIEANTPNNLETLKALAQSISKNVKTVNSSQRQQIHIAAVFVCNFVNHLYTIGEELLSEKGIDFEILKPLIMETAIKATQNSSKKSQTGPAVRNDKNVMNKQLALLESHPDLQTLYTLFSNRIIKTYLNS